ncbi:hypothetical protein Aduo_010488 [Ancylostoma duodenale]
MDDDVYAGSSRATRVQHATTYEWTSRRGGRVRGRMRGRRREINSHERGLFKDDSSTGEEQLEKSSTPSQPATPQFMVTPRMEIPPPLSEH